MRICDIWVSIHIIFNNLNKPKKSLLFFRPLKREKLKELFSKIRVKENERQ